MRLFDRFRQRKKNTAKEVTQVLLNEFGGLKDSFYAPFSGQPSEAQETCLETNAAYASKVELASVLAKKNGEQVRDYPALDRLLQLSPNPTMPAATFWERAAYYYWKYNNTFLYIERDGRDIKALWSIDPSVVEVSKVSATGEYLLKFQLNGRQVECLYSEIIHVGRMVTGSMLFGDRISPAIQKLIDLINLNYTGIENAIKTSALIRFIGTIPSVMDEEAKKKAAETFTDQYLNPKNNTIGILFSDGKVKYEPIANPQQYTAKYTDVNQWNAAIYKYYGCPEKVISGEASENEIVSYYERTIEPYFIKLSQELTRKLFSAKEIAVGNQIVYRDKKLLYYSMATRLQMFNSARELGAFTLGTLADLLGLDVAPGKRDEVVVSQNYIESTQSGTKPPEEDNGNTDGNED